jgi:MSHA biogenesis protein MshN
MGAAEMSVINTMLKDLEQRGGKRDQSKEEILQGLSSSTTGIMREREFNPYLVSLFSVLGVCVILMLVYLYLPYQLVAARQESQAQPVAVAQPQATPVAADAKVIAAKATGDTESDSAVAEQTTALEKQIAPPLQATEASSLAQAKRSVERTAKIAQPQHTVQDGTAPTTANVVASTGKLKNTRQAKQDTVDRTDAVNKRSAAQTALTKQGESDSDISKTKREPSNDEKSVNTYVLAMDLYSQGRTDEARLQLKQALVLDPANSKASQLLAAIYLGDDHPELAVDVLNSSLKLRPADQDLLRLYLQVQVQMKNYAQAIDIMERRMRLNTPEDVAYLAGLHQKNNDHIGAARLYAQALKLKPSNSVWWMGQGISFEALGMNEEAMKSYRQSIESGRLNTQLAEYVLGRIASIEKSIKNPVS